MLIVRPAVVAIALAFAACSAPAPTPAPAGSASSVTHAPTEPAQEFKPGSHSAGIVRRLQGLHVAQPGRFQRLLKAFNASHGDVNHPAMAAIRQDVMNWIGIDETDFAKLPADMKTFSGSGPYRRLTTKQGFSYVSGSVFVPRNATHLHPTSRPPLRTLVVGAWEGAGTPSMQAFSATMR